MTMRSVKTLLVIGLCLACFFSQAQNKKLYLKAFSYLKLKYPNKSFVIGDTTLRLTTMFSAELSKLWGKSETATILILDSLDHVPLKTQKLDFFKTFSKQSIKIWPAKLVYFSSIRQNMLTAEVFTIGRNTKDLRYSKLASFNQSDTYLFIFNNSGNLKNVFHGLVDYD